MVTPVIPKAARRTRPGTGALIPFAPSASSFPDPSRSRLTAAPGMPTIPRTVPPRREARRNAAVAADRVTFPGLFAWQLLSRRGSQRGQRTGNGAAARRD